MKFFAVAALFTSVLAAPALEERTWGNPPSNYHPCNGGLYSQAQCCATDVLGVACLDGAPRKLTSHEVVSKKQLANMFTANETPRDAKNFQEICAKKGQQARCCVIPVLGQDVLCVKPVGI